MALPALSGFRLELPFSMRGKRSRSSLTAVPLSHRDKEGSFTYAPAYKSAIMARRSVVKPTGTIIPIKSLHNQQRCDDQRYDGHQLDQDIHGRAGGILERIAHGIANNRRFMRIGAFTTQVASFDIFLGICPKHRRRLPSAGPSSHL